MIETRPRRTAAATIEEIEAAVDESLLEVLAVGNPEEIQGRAGGKFTAKQVGADSFKILSYRTGTIEFEVDPTAFAIEKVVRLERNFLVKGHHSSFESRNNEEKKWPGAVICHFRRKYYAFGFSALPWKYDEAICLLAAYKIGYLTMKEAVKIARDKRATEDVNEIFLMCAERLQAEA